MKVGIMTFPNSVSYGAALQMVALQNAVSRLDHEVEVINYHNPYMKAEKHAKKGSRHPLRSEVQRLLRPWMHRRLYTAFGNFETQYAHCYPKHAFTNKKQLVDMGKRYDAVICGSDQVWSPFVTDTDLSFFLDFCTDRTRRIAYAPSFGAEEFSEEFYQKITPELERFSALSARELPGKQLVERLTGRETTVVADPTFLMDAAAWEQMEKAHPAASGEYVLYFVLGWSEQMMRRCEAFAKQQGIKMVVVGGNPMRARRNRNPMIEYAIDIGPQEWLYLMRHARYVFTNSFHGTAFSIIFQKDFYVHYPAHTGSRLRQLVETMGLGERVFDEQKELIGSSVDYAKAQKAFAEMKEQSLAYLENALK